VKKVLIITYYWPPSGGAGVQRWLKFVKYLRKFGWEPVIYTAENPDYPVLDESLSNDIPEGVEVLKRPITEPYSIYKRLLGKKSDEKVFNVFVSDEHKKSWKKKLALYVRANLFIPDARCFWIKPSIRFLKSYLKNENVDAIVSTGPPHSMHLIAKGLKKRISLPWLADFRDPWTNIDFADDMPFTKRSLNRQKVLEFSVLKKADKIVVVSDQMKEEFEHKTDKPIIEITNGFDWDDFNRDVLSREGENYVLAHTGSLNNRRNHPALWQAIKNLRYNEPSIMQNFKIKLIGNVDSSALADIEKNGLTDITELCAYLPHEKVVEEQMRANLLFLSVNRYVENSKEFKSSKATLTGKLFEYLATGNPILALGVRQSQLENILHKTTAGNLFEFDEVLGVEKFISKCVKGFTESRNESEIEKYSREHLTSQLAKVLNQLIAEK
jgi:hypothetical protein